jgi:post-segregation antitoxin (ccd killing protein)
MSQRHRIISISIARYIDEELVNEAKARQISKSRLVEHALVKELSSRQPRNQQKPEPEEVPT